MRKRLDITCNYKWIKVYRGRVWRGCVFFIPNSISLCLLINCYYRWFSRWFPSVHDIFVLHICSEVEGWSSAGAARWSAVLLQRRGSSARQTGRSNPPWQTHLDERRAARRPVFSPPWPHNHYTPSFFPYLPSPVRTYFLLMPSPFINWIALFPFSSRTSKQCLIYNWWDLWRIGGRVRSLCCECHTLTLVLIHEPLWANNVSSCWFTCWCFFFGGIFSRIDGYVSKMEFLCDFLFFFSGWLRRGRNAFSVQSGLV